MANVSKLTLLYLAAFASYPIIFLYGAFPGEASWSLAPLPILLSLFSSAIVFALLMWKFKNEQVAAPLTAFFIFLFFVYGHIANAFEQYVIGLGSGNGSKLIHITPYGATLWIALALGALCFAYLRPKAFIFELSHRLAPILSLTLVSLVALSIVMGKNIKKIVPLSEKVTYPKHESILGYKPDIYYIVLDGYARADVLRAFYKYKNHEFLSALKKRGFQTLEGSFANYARTHLSLTSTLNMIHLQEIARNFGNVSRDRGDLYEMLRNNTVSQFLKAQGYRYVHLASTGGETMINPYADKLYSCSKNPFKHELYRVLVEGTVLRMLYNDIGNDLANCHLENYKTLSKIPDMEQSPKFVFAHTVSPHHPYLFSSTGKILRRATISNQFEYDKQLWRRKDLYLEQLKFLNKTIVKIVDDILKKSARPPIILITSDHGPNLNYEGLTRVVAHSARHANLVTAFFPDKKAVLPHDLRIVNLFPYVLNHYFATNFSLQSDKMYQTRHNYFDYVEVDPIKGPIYNYKGPMFRANRLSTR